ncbi:MAG: ABC transporter permease [Rhodocyclaceae bacterium]|jgi:putative spermidine/putrescine transport system permease protein|nr:ABC transporter permease [Rhodocyclaceae bacterium]MCE2979337.1 ABC transporter permease [Betaproteobacteria bacterium]MCA3075060.1 ABC transporter permease [Rhodocyclaceae bacterium]MCA3092237.1 ABC transporter permease [Rhodocyclaceae bacterium]MCA3096054.1 ABC transporter permease [Rhodocyclaceae bacterium]
MGGRERLLLLALMAPAAIVFAAFFLLPLARLFVIGGTGPTGWSAYLAIVTDARYFRSLVSTVLLSASVTAATLVISGIAGVFLERNRFRGRALVTAMLTLPLAFPGVVIGFMVIMLAGRQGLIPEITDALFNERLVFAYSMAGLFMGYVYFSIPRTILTVMASAEKLDPRLEEAARSLGARPWRVVTDVIVPGLKPAFISAGAICFATAMGAFGTAFTLATRINVLPMVIYTEFTLQANLVMASALSFVLGAITWAALALARSFAGSSVAAAG